MRQSAGVLYEEVFLPNRLTVQILTRNEEEMLPGCLASVAWADEILVVDSFSTDRTREIAEASGARFLQHKFDNFAAQHNWGLEQATGDWILVVDADEVVDEELGASVRAVVSSERAEFEIYNVIRDAFFLGKRMRSAAWSGERIPRLFRRGGMTYSGLVHQKTETGGRPIGTLRGRLLHYTYRSMAQYFDKMRLYSDLWAENAFRNGKKVGIPRVFVSAWWRFMHNYFVRGEIVDGAYGLITASLYSIYTFTKYLKLWGLNLHRDGHDGV